MQKPLIICGPTATGKTSFGLKVAKKLNGEIISADSRQVYTGMDIVTGKDLPVDNPDYFPLSLVKRGGQGVSSKEDLVKRGVGPACRQAGVSLKLQWKNRFLRYYLIDNIKVWLYDIVNPDEEFNLSFWKECADLVIADIHKRGKLPIVVGGTGLYIKSLTQNLDQINVSPNQKLRNKLAGKSPGYLLDYLAKLDQSAADRLNDSDRSNPRRLIRAIEITQASKQPGLYKLKAKSYQLFQVGLTASKEFLYSRIDQRVDERVASGAENEVKKLLKKYSSNLPSMTSSGYRAFLGPDPINRWKTLEHQYARRQLVWFKKQPNVNWFDISVLNWQPIAVSMIADWYNKL